MEMRQKKAEVLKQQQELEQRRRAQEEHTQKQVAREQVRRDKDRQQWKQRAQEQGLLEAQECMDGQWYVELGQGLWQKVDYQFWCKHCEAGMSEAAIESHLGGERHRKRSANCSLATHTPATTCFPQAVCGDGRTQCCMEKWQAVDGDGQIRCIPCNKYCDGVHEQTKEHANRVWEYLVTLEGDYKEPEESWLAWVKADEPGYAEGLYLKCLLCKKWVTDLAGADPSGYDGQHGRSADNSTKQHKKFMSNLASYMNDQAFWNGVLAERSKWHPPIKPLSDMITPVPEKPEKPSPPELPDGWWAEWSKEQQQYYFYSAVDESQWEMPTTVAAEAGA